MAFQVYNPKPLSAEAEKLLAENGIISVRGDGDEKSDLLRDIRDADAIVVWKSSKYTIDKEVIDAAGRLKLIARFGTGMEIIDVEYARERDILVTNTPTANANAVAEQTIYLLLALAKNGLSVNDRIRAGEFSSIWKTPALELAGKTLGLIGNGHIGSLVAKKARYGLDMEVIGYNPHKSSVFPEEIKRVDSLDTLLSRADVLSLHLPSTPETRGMFGAEEFKKMKNEAYFINTSRGEIVDEAALISALQNGEIRGAGLDVFAKEPPEKDNPLFSLPNVVLTPHYGGHTKTAVERTGVQVAESIVAVSRGETPTFLYQG